MDPNEGDAEGAFDDDEGVSVEGWLGSAGSTVGGLGAGEELSAVLRAVSDASKSARMRGTEFFGAEGKRTSGAEGSVELDTTRNL